MILMVFLLPYLAAAGSYDMVLKKKVPYIDSWVL